MTTAASTDDDIQRLAARVPSADAREQISARRSDRRDRAGLDLAGQISFSLGEHMDDALVETFRRIYSAVQRGDAAELHRNLTHDVEWILPEAVPWGGTHHGHLGVEAAGERFREHVDGLWADPDEFLVAGERVVVLGRVSGTARSSGQSFEVSFAHVWGLSEGVPSRFRAYFDTAPITAALRGSAA